MTATPPVMGPDAGAVEQTLRAVRAAQPLPPVEPVGKKGAAEGNADAVDVGRWNRLRQHAARAVHRQDRDVVEALRQAVQDGQFTVDAGKLAQAILDVALEPPPPKLVPPKLEAP